LFPNAKEIGNKPPLQSLQLRFDPDQINEETFFALPLALAIPFRRRTAL
jgi:hypothetical protein